MGDLLSLNLSARPETVGKRPWTFLNGEGVGRFGGKYKAPHASLPHAAHALVDARHRLPVADSKHEVVALVKVCLRWGRESVHDQQVTRSPDTGPLVRALQRLLSETLTAPDCADSILMLPST